MVPFPLLQTSEFKEPPIIICRNWCFSIDPRQHCGLKLAWKRIVFNDENPTVVTLGHLFLLLPKQGQVSFLSFLAFSHKHGIPMAPLPRPHRAWHSPSG